MGLELLDKVTNTYERKARLYPVLLMLIPVFVLLAGVYGIAVEFKEATIGLLISFGIFYLAASFSRELGKRAESALYLGWGGKPTTLLLRHRDTSLDPVTKDRYHAILAKKMGIRFPTPNEETEKPENADYIYQAATTWLIEQTRDNNKFDLLFQENIAYGFRRNCYGMKLIAIFISVTTLLWSLVIFGAIDFQGFHIAILAKIPTGGWFSIGASILSLSFWAVFFTNRTVKTAAFSYADRLFKSCDQI